jgi:hypothetical protein
MIQRDRDSLLRAYRRELSSVGDDKERTEAIKAEMERVEALPPHPVDENAEPTPAERESLRAHAYLAALRKERSRSDKAHAKEVDAEIARVEAALHEGPTTEQAREVPKAETATVKPS